jgi:hypothetical protein
MKKAILLITLVVVTAVAGLLASTVTANVHAKITQETTDTSCTNGGGNEPGGQQPSCTGSGLTQNTETENVNPSGSAPPGQNK